MGQLKMNPTVIIRTLFSMKESVENIKNHLGAINNKYNGIYDKAKVGGFNASLSEVQLRLEKVEEGVKYLEKIVDDLERATGISREDLLENNYSNDFYEKKISDYIICNYGTSSNGLSLLTEKDTPLLDVLPLENVLFDMKRYMNNSGLNQDEFKQFLQVFNYSRFGMSLQEALDELKAIKARGDNYYSEIKWALLNCCPKNYDDFNFNPKY